MSLMSLNDTPALFESLESLVDNHELPIKVVTLECLPYLPLYTCAAARLPRSGNPSDRDETWAVSSAFTWERAYINSLRVALAPYIHRAGSMAEQAGYSIGIGKNYEEALLHASIRHRETAMALSIESVEQIDRLTGWESIVPEAAPALRAIEQLGGTVDLYGLEYPGYGPMVGAILRLERHPYLFGSLSFHTEIASAASAAIEQILHKLYVDVCLQDVGEERDRPWRTMTEQSAAAAFPWLHTAANVPLYEWSARFAPLSDNEFELKHGIQPQCSISDFTIGDGGPHQVSLCVISEEPSAEQAGRNQRWLDSFWYVPEHSAIRPADLHMPDGLQDTRLSRLYHHNSKIRKLSRVDDFIIPMHLINTTRQKIIAQSAKDYRYARLRYVLPDVRDSRTAPIEETILKRRSTFPFDPNLSLTMHELSHLLYFSYGSTGVARNKKEGIENRLRAAPSGGALYPIDLYLLIHRVEGVEPGVYYYNPLLHELFLVTQSYAIAEAKSYISDANRFAQSALTVLFSANFRRNQWKYRERGYRITMLDCGHLGQNMLLMAGSLGMVGHGFMGYIEDYFDGLCNLDGSDESIVYLMMLGKRGQKQDSTEVNK